MSKSIYGSPEKAAIVRVFEKEFGNPHHKRSRYFRERNELFEKTAREIIKIDFDPKKPKELTAMRIKTIFLLEKMVANLHQHTHKDRKTTV